MKLSEIIRNYQKMQKQVMKYHGFWSKSVTQKYPKLLFIFGDNLAGFGHGGQAVIRGMPNALGIPTKKYPSDDKSSFFTDKELDKNMAYIDQAIDLIKARLEFYDGIVLPENGIGTGFARLETCAPKTMVYLTNQIKSLKDYVVNYKE